MYKTCPDVRYTFINKIKMKTLVEKLNENSIENNSLTEILCAKSILINNNKDNDSMKESQEKENKGIQSQSDKD